MSYTFQSRATADLIMLKASAEQILKLLDRPLHVPGVITVAQIPDTLAILEKAAQEDDARRQAIEAEMKQASEDVATQEAAAVEAGVLGPVSFRHRIVPFVEMLRTSAQEDKPVTWIVS